MAALIIFRCPQTGMNVQTLLPTQKDEVRTYEAVTCPSCTRLHFIDTSTGKPAAGTNKGAQAANTATGIGLQMTVHVQALTPQEFAPLIEVAISSPTLERIPLG